MSESHLKWPSGNELKFPMSLTKGSGCQNIDGELDDSVEAWTVPIAGK